VLTLAEIARTLREVRRPAPTLYVVTDLTPPGSVYQMGTVAMGPESLAQSMADAGIEVLWGGESIDYRAAVLTKHGALPDLLNPTPNPRSGEE
jgi:cell division protein FtsI/penicillin-binding protein 2